MRAGLILSLTMALPLLSGCAAALIPVVAGGAIVGQQTGVLDGSKQDELSASAEQPAPAEVDRPAEPAPQLIAPNPAETAVAAAPSEPPVMGDKEEAETGEAGDYAAFLGFAADRARTHAQGKSTRSVILAPDSTLEAPSFLPCGKRPPAVLIDMDGDAAEDFGAADADPKLAEGLAALRRAGVAILWITDVPLEKIGFQRNRLRDAGLDREARDVILTKARSTERKQMIRQAAAAEFCIIALAGDRRHEADELYAHLKQPSASAPLEPYWGAGWFLVPPPLYSAEAESAQGKDDNALDPR